MTIFFTAPDAADEPTIWEATDRDPAVVVRRAELPGPHADLLWRVLTGVLTEDGQTVERLAHALIGNRKQLAHLSVLPEGTRDVYRRDARSTLAALRDAD